MKPSLMDMLGEEFVQVGTSWFLKEELLTTAHGARSASIRVGHTYDGLTSSFRSRYAVYYGGDRVAVLTDLEEAKNILRKRWYGGQKQ